MTLIVDPDDGTVLERRDGLLTDDPGYSSAYLAMGPAWSLPVEPTLLRGCTDWAIC